MGHRILRTAAALLGAVVVGVTCVPDASAQTGSYMWSFGVKFVCGVQQANPAVAALVGEPAVKPGNYATEINVHNANYRRVPLKQKVLLLVDNGTSVGLEPRTAKPIPAPAIVLGPDAATMMDCNTLWKLSHSAAGSVLPTVMPLTIGYFVILSSLDLDVNAVYTASPMSPNGGFPAALSEDVVTVTGKRVFVPTP